MQAAIIGAGVIGSGWVCRFLLHGWDVVVYDKDPDANVCVAATLARAEQALASLYDRAELKRGALTFADSAEAAVAGADWVQESLPESMDVKQSFYQAVHPYLAEHTPLASSTSGFKPSELSMDQTYAEQLLVCHPFNPVYLLPAVEGVSGQRTNPSIAGRALDTLRDLGMHPVAVRAEIDAHVADRLLEALWREALWLVKDGVATTEEIDNIMRYGFGLRWAQMGLFETYRIGGGDAGMRHFLEQFGPALAWPWSRLTDVPEMDEALINRIVEQSDAQSGDLSIAELEARRDENLVAILRALRGTNHGAGRIINEYLSPVPDGFPDLP